MIARPDDGYLPLLKKLVRESSIEEKIILTGPLYGNDKLQAYVDADVCVLPSSYETFPMVVLESLACSTPVIITERCGLANVIREQAGLVIPFSEDKLNDALRQILADDKMRQEFGKQGKLLISKQFTWPRVVARLEDIYKNCLGS